MKTLADILDIQAHHIALWGTVLTPEAFAGLCDEARRRNDALPPGSHPHAVWRGVDIDNFIHNRLMSMPTDAAVQDVCAKTRRPVSGGFLSAPTKLSKDGSTVFVPLPPENYRPIPGGCRCDYCVAHPEKTPCWDTLAVPVSGSGHTHTVHYPNL